MLDFGDFPAYTIAVEKEHKVFKTSLGRENLEMKNVFKRLWQEEEGQDLVEYGLLLVLIALAAITAMGTLASAIKNVFTSAASNLSSS